MNNRKNAYTEVYEILSNLIEEDYQKIPPEVIKAIEENRNKEYEFELDDDIELKDQNLLTETKAILFNLFRDYLATPEQKEKIIKMQNEERRKNELKKQQIYDSDVFKNKEKKSEEKVETKDENLEMIKYRESFFEKILNKIRIRFKKR